MTAPYHSAQPLRTRHFKQYALGWLAIVTNLLSLAATTAIADVDQAADPVERGRYLATAGNCTSCHTRNGGAPFSGGVAFHTDFGTIYSTNITSDAKTGIGGWTEEQFISALREGIRADGSHLYPAFPYTAFTKITDADATALWAFLKTVDAVNYRPPENDMRFPFNQRWLLGVWKALFFETGSYQQDASQSAEWNRGAYLVQGLGHCGACHSPRNFLGAEDNAMALTGGGQTHPSAGKLRAWSTTNLTTAPSGLGAWSVDEVASYLHFGVSARAGVFGPMNEVILNSTRHMSQSDVRAMAVYLKSLPAREQSVSKTPSAETLRKGDLLYSIHCGTCHLPTGLGSDTTAPPLAGSSIVLAPDPASLINATLHAPELPHEAPSSEWQARRWKTMEPYADKLSDQEVADLLSYVRNNWGNRASAVEPADVSRQR
ncbi:cytochrome c [Peristeroidobacter soli]|uniref:cytochrome c n=1 Tax=Peristeroidobacter soli TaxID=2497877 RepID=UPI00101C133B|nr:cytochrome c [Peristeroidobacter soli]